MGLFDTIHLEPPLLCPSCGAEQRTLQTHVLGEMMAHYKVGSVLRCNPVLTGIMSETLWCRTCHAAGRESSSPVFIVIWHSVLAGVERDATKAEGRLAAIDRLDLIEWLDAAQREASEWRKRSYALYHDVERWHQRLTRAAATEPADTSPEAERRHAFQRFFDLPEEILTAPDPLAAILASHKPKEQEPDE